MFSSWVILASNGGSMTKQRTEEEFQAWLAEAVEHMDHTLVSIRNTLYVIGFIAIIFFVFK